ncbi:prolyl oligopeptidase family serine peptidase [Caulobacter sp. SLTY]|uniref:alpha/beta hydrolase family protein n=1 Tax=Caulobacter sp. SLTY TaxID=2683262 RepID=UPI0014124C56|nr:alpha/beta hydrolase [Caulobacter sp. SLTY]NBB13799.1 prolyl oligopeptidase family serine peptidase [Caulobacter sp. SLTY]
MRAFAWIAATLVLLSGAAGAAPPEETAFKALRAAYAAKDAAAAAAAYAPDAEVIYRYAGTPEDRRAGTTAIAASFRELFDQIDPATAIDLNFRVAETAGDRRVGYYRMRIGKAASYGRFEVRLGKDGRFVQDISSDGTVSDFESVAGPLMFANEDEVLDRDFHEALTGRYRLPDGCVLVVTRSVVRLFARNSCDNSFRGLNRVSGLEWTAGDRVRSDKAVATWRFAPPTDGTSAAVTVDGLIAVRADAYRRERVVFPAKDGVKLAGQLYLPSGRAGTAPAVVLVHGSGPQDRDGYASIIAVMADALAASGRVVLTYDKRGVDGSGGDWSRAGFDSLAQDAMAGMAFLATRPEVDASRIGLAGSSQAGWVAAAVLRQGGTPADVFLLGAAGAALTVAEQNLYNTKVRMGCAGIAGADIDLALRQQSAFFAFLRDGRAAPELDRLTAEGRKRAGLGDWLFPASGEVDRSAGDWFVTLDPAFDPLPLWRAYGGKAMFVFAEHDDSTPTSVATGRLKGVPVQVRVLSGAQHLGLRAGEVCRAELTDTTAFSPDLFRALEAFAI